MYTVYVNICCLLLRGNELRTKLNALKVELDNMLDTVRNWDYDQMSDAEFDGNLAKVKKVLQEGKLVPYLFFAAFLGVFLFLLHVFGVVFCDFAVNPQLVEAK